MSKAEEKANNACPINKGSGIDRVISMVNRKNGYIQGYMQAEKDLALTWEDMVTIDTLGSEVITEHLFDNWSERQIYEEVLRRFREMKNKQ